MFVASTWADELQSRNSSFVRSFLIMLSIYREELILCLELQMIYIWENSSVVTEDSGESAVGILLKIILEGRFLILVSIGSKDSFGLCNLPSCSFNLSRLFVEYVQSSISHLNGFSVEWIFWCRFSWPASTKPLPQVSHLKHFSPLWARMCALRRVPFGVQYWHPSKVHLWTRPSWTRLWAAMWELYLVE